MKDVADVNDPSLKTARIPLTPFNNLFSTVQPTTIVNARTKLFFFLFLAWRLDCNDDAHVLFIPSTAMINQVCPLSVIRESHPDLQLDTRTTTMTSKT